MKTKHIQIAFIVGSFVLLIAGYSNTFTSPFVLDDIHSFVRNPVTHVKEFSPEILNQLSRTQFGLFRFLPMVTFAFDYWWGNGSIVAYHVTNIFIHISCYLACLWMLWSILNIPVGSPLDKNEKFFIAAAVAIIWALHPVQTSAVTYLVQRMASMQAFFYMAAIAAFVQGRTSLNVLPFKAFVWWTITILLSIGAFLSKENSAILPIILLAVEISFFRPQALKKLPSSLVRRLKTPGGVVSATLIVCLLIFFGAFIVNSCAKGYDIRHFTMAERLLTEARIVMSYFFTILIPNPTALSLEHDVEISRSFFSPPTTALSILAIGSLLSAGILGLRRWPLVSFGIFWFFLNLLIESTIVPLELTFDHRMYLPSVGLLLSAFEVARRLLSKLFDKWTAHERKKMAWSALAIVCSFLSLMTFVRNEDWENGVTINADAVRKAPNHPRAHANYASALIRAGRYAEALQEARKAIELGKDHFEEHFVAATAIVVVYAREGDFQKALDEGERLLEQAPEAFDATALPSFLCLLGELQVRLGRYAEAYNLAERALKLILGNPRLRPDAPMVYGLINRTVLAVFGESQDIDGDGLPDPGNRRTDEWIVSKLYDLGDWDGLKIFAAGSESSPAIEEVKRNISLLKQRNDMQSFQWGYQKKLYEPSSFADILTGLAYVMRMNESWKGMRKIGPWLLRHANALKPNNMDVPLLEGWYAFEDGRIEDAVAKAKQAIELAPQSAKAWIALGFFEQRAGRLENALTAFRHTLELYPGYPKRHILKDLMAQLESQIHAQNLESSKIAQAALH